MRTLLPRDYATSAHRTGALVRCRNVPSAEALVRMLLAYALTDMSLKDVAAWGQAMKVATMTGPGLFYRVREAEKWLGEMVAGMVQTSVDEEAGRGLRLRVVDATVVNGPGRRSTDWRVHVTTDAATGTLTAAEITDAHGGEGYERHVFAPEDVVLGDRMYATAKGLYAVVTDRAAVVARLNPHTLRVCNVKRRKIVVRSYEHKVPRAGVLDIDVTIPIPPPKSRSHKTWKLDTAIAWVPARIVACRARNGEIIWVLTSLPRRIATGVRVLLLYRLRWQIELFFKRLKSLLHFDTLPSRCGPTAKSWLLARLLAAALAQRLTTPNGAFSPWGFDLRNIPSERQRLVAF